MAKLTRFSNGKPRRSKDPGRWYGAAGQSARYNTPESLVELKYYSGTTDKAHSGTVGKAQWDSRQGTVEQSAKYSGLRPSVCLPACSERAASKTQSLRCSPPFHSCL
eukprot:2703515-Pyramimonas_sp.AAC.1